MWTAIIIGDVIVVAIAIAIYHYGVSGTIQKLKDDIAYLKTKV